MECVRVKDVQVLSNDWYVLKKTRFERRRRNGTWQELTRETYDRGNGATILLYNVERRSVILTRQFRYPAYVNGHDGLLIEAAAGLLDEASREERIRAEAAEETGYHVLNTVPTAGRAMVVAIRMKGRTSRCWRCRWMTRSWASTQA